jgi:hypothetical protein
LNEELRALGLSGAESLRWSLSQEEDVSGRGFIQALWSPVEVSSFGGSAFSWCREFFPGREGDFLSRGHEGTPRKREVTDGDEIRNRSIPFDIHRKRVLHGRWSSIMLPLKIPVHPHATRGPRPRAHR